MRDRLIELIQQSVKGCARNWAEIIAEYLLENGIIAPPCAIDAEIFMLKDRYKGKKIVKTDIVKAHIDCFTIGEAKRVIADVCDEEGDFYIALGAEDFYLSYEAAEQALKERE